MKNMKMKYAYQYGELCISSKMLSQMVIDVIENKSETDEMDILLLDLARKTKGLMIQHEESNC